MTQIKAHSKQGGLSEIYSTGLQFSFVSPNDEMCHAWVLCKDFLTDAIWASLNNKTANIYGFMYDPATNPKISLDPVKLAIRNKSKTNDVLDLEIQKSLQFLHAIEDRLDFTKSSLEKVEDGDKYSVWMFTCDKRWVHAPPMISLLTLFIRVGCHYDGLGNLNQAIRQFKKVTHNDATYIKTSRPLRLLILQSGLSIFNEKMEDNYPAGTGINTVHNYWGIVNAPTASGKVKGWNFDNLNKVVKKKKVVKKPKGKAKVNLTVQPPTPTVAQGAPVNV